ncbi:UPF0462 protein C4orf33 homolog isoform X3 [Dendropsophus ebraccatus]|uniref:UPF0462 protein C4orf33 homolog isoform X3 n=1 Tax=Dendropsophus ebraccatus TaxID=150705 RepID=UPI00383163B9
MSYPVNKFSMEFSIQYEWNSAPISHDPVTICLKPTPEGLQMEVSAPFFNDPPAPLGPAGEPFQALWDHEVIEAFFLNSETEQYLQVILGPHGHHLVLLLSQCRNIWKQCLPLSYRATISQEAWKGAALIPWEYFPPQVDRFNAFASHGSGLKKTYEALYPVPEKEVVEGQHPDFHRLEYFRPFSCNVLMGEEWKEPASSLWNVNGKKGEKWSMSFRELMTNREITGEKHNNLEREKDVTVCRNENKNVLRNSRGHLLRTGVNREDAKAYDDKQLTYRITTTWDSKPVLHEPVTITFKPHHHGLLMDVYAPFFDDPAAPPGKPGEPFNGLWDFEVVESFFLNSETTRYLEVELCPHGQHLVLLLSGVRNAFKTELPLEFAADTASEWGKWRGTALIPWSYFPPGVDRMNSYAIHGSGTGRVYESLYPIPPQEIAEGQGPNFHRLEYFKEFNLKWIMGEEWQQPSSDFWEPSAR